MFDDDLPLKKTTHEFPRKLENMSVSDLEEYISDLKEEISRVEGDIHAKKASMDAASSVFK